MIHPFSIDISPTEIPALFTFPFHYTPHPLCIRAAQEVQAYLHSRTDWQAELQQGKMFGVLVVQTPHDKIGWLAAFSGILAGKNRHEFFVPPVFDFLQPDGYFKTEERKISELNHAIETAEHAPALQCIQEETAKRLQQERQSLENFQCQCQQRKQERDQHRGSGLLSAEQQAELIRQSQFDKAEIKRRKQHFQQLEATCAQILQEAQAPILALKEQRKEQSAALQQWLFRHFEVHNAKGVSQNLLELFREAIGQLPPAGAGECAAPKLLQYAYLNGCKPIAMAEFWWGDSPKQEIRRHGMYYPSCKQKCEPILNFMLQGLHVEPNPLTMAKTPPKVGDILYEDASICIINKPAGMLSVPGKHHEPSVYSWMAERYPDATGPLLVHRLDMDTSGILLIAKDKDTHALLQQQFENRAVKKRYIALLEGIPACSEEKGFIRLPLRPDYENRPYQLVDKELGKPAVTRYEIIGTQETEGKRCTRIAYYPETGRTHQLRVHSAHAEGMNCPILGDPLYGQPAQRLYLHAEELTFRHPVSQKILRIRCEAPF